MRRKQMPLLLLGGVIALVGLGVAARVKQSGAALGTKTWSLAGGGEQHYAG